MVKLTFGALMTSYGIEHKQLYVHGVVLKVFLLLHRTVAPVFVGSIYSVSLTDGLSFPLNYHLIFIIFGIIMLIVMVMVACLPKTINKQKVVASSHQESSGVGNGGETGEVTREPEGLLEIDQEQQDVSASNNHTDV